MMDFLRAHQLNIMLVLIGICGITAFFVYITGTLSKKRKRALMLVEIYSTILLISDRFAYIYRGDTSRLGYWMVRFSNFLVFFMTLAVVHAINLYMIDLMKNEAGQSLYPITGLSDKLYFSYSRNVHNAFSSCEIPEQFQASYPLSADTFCARTDTCFIRTDKSIRIVAYQYVYSGDGRDPVCIRSYRYECICITGT